MKKFKLKLKPSARDKRRYFLVNASDEEVKKAIFHYVGVLGFAESCYMFVKKNKKGVVGSCLRESLNDVRAALALAGFSVEKVSGTLKGLEQ